MHYQTTGISPLIDSVQRMIIRKAGRTYDHLDRQHKRWQDPEDVLQEALLAAFDAERTFDSKGGSKYSTYAFTKLDWRMQKFQTHLNQQMRRCRRIAEIDAPVSGDDESETQFSLPDPATQDIQLNCLRTFVALCRAVSQDAAVMLIRGFLFSDFRRKDPVVCQEVATICAKLGIGFADFDYLQDAEIRKKALTQISQNVMLSSEAERKLRCLECVECGCQSSIDAIRNGRFYVSTMTCGSCYAKLQALPSQLSCFGKAKTDSEGYSVEDKECRLHCPDRVACRDQIKLGDSAMATKKDQKTKAPVAKAKSVEDVDFDDVEGKAKSTKPAATAKAKSKKEVKKEQKPEVDDVPVPKGMVRWPWKKGSALQTLFQNMYEGCDAAKLKKEFGRAPDGNGEYNWPFMLRAMRAGIGGGKGRETHSFKLNEEGGRFKIYDVKYIGGKVEEKPAKKTEKAAKTPKADKVSKKAPVEPDEDED